MNAPETFREYPTVERCLGGVARFDDAPQWIYNLDNPYVHGVYAPTTEEVTADGLAITGELPADLVGA